MVLKITVNLLIITVLNWLFLQLTEYWFVELMIKKKLLDQSNAINFLPLLIWKSSRLMTPMVWKKYV